MGTSFADRFYEKKWGVFCHFLFDPPGGSHLKERLSELPWDTRVSMVDTDKLAAALHEMGAGYFFITLMQGRKYMAAPNATYDRIAGTKPGEACPHRDLIEDLYTSLSRYGIDLYLYYTGDGPYIDREVGERFGFVEPRKDVSEDFVRKWASVLDEYARRYKGKVRGWWIDGCYPYFGYTTELLTIYHDTLKAVDPDCGIAFNVHGVKDELIKNHPLEDFTPGEFNSPYYVPKARFIDGAQAHLLMPVGPMWGTPGCTYTREQMADYVRRVREAGGIPTFDVLILPDGSFDPAQQDALTLRGML
ncbi:MAG: hypothetical protein J6D21_06215 [Clostridia bacterium]|nr:hypothetical protein [Clostridia bacterium]